MSMRSAASFRLFRCLLPVLTAATVPALEWAELTGPWEVDLPATAALAPVNGTPPHLVEIWKQSAADHGGALSLEFSADGVTPNVGPSRFNRLTHFASSSATQASCQFKPGKAEVPTGPALDVRFTLLASGQLEMQATESGFAFTLILARTATAAACATSAAKP